MTGDDVLALIIATEGALILLLMAFNSVFLVQRPVLHHIKEIYFLNSGRFRQAWYLVISATTFFFLVHATTLLAALGVAVEPERVRMAATVFTLSFGTLILVAFLLLFSVFIRYVHRLPVDEEEIYRRIATDLRRHVTLEDRALSLETDLSRVGDIVTHRPRLGPHVSLSHYRAVTAGFSSYMEHKLGHMGDAILYAVGRLTARQATQELLRESGSRERARQQMFDEIRENGIGIPEVRASDETHVVVRLEESAPAAGIQPTGRTVCHYQAGMLAGMYEALLGRPTLAVETKCWGRGDRSCEFRIDL